MMVAGTNSRYNNKVKANTYRAEFFTSYISINLSYACINDFLKSSSSRYLRGVRLLVTCDEET